MAPVLNNISELKKFSSASLYGAGSLGAYSLLKIKEALPELQIDYFIDDMKSGSFHSIPITAFHDYKKHPSDVILITSSYWRDISQKLKGSGISYFVLDLLSAESAVKIREKKISNTLLRFATPNTYLNEVFTNFEIIEPLTIEWINKFRKDSVFYDIGASCGIYSIYASATTKCRSVTFEPDAQNHSIIEQNHYLNKEAIGGKLISLNLGLSNRPGILPLACQDFLVGSHGKIFHSGSRELQSNMEVAHTQYTLCDSLDHLILRYKLAVPTHIKIDVDGFEIQVLEGARDTFYGNSLREVLIESDTHKIEQIKTILSPAGFRLEETQKINEITGFPVSGVNNYLFIKKA